MPPYFGISKIFWNFQIEFRMRNAAASGNLRNQEILKRLDGFFLASSDALLFIQRYLEKSKSCLATISMLANFEPKHASLTKKSYCFESNDANIIYLGNHMSHYLDKNIKLRLIGKVVFRPKGCKYDSLYFVDSYLVVHLVLLPSISNPDLINSFVILQEWKYIDGTDDEKYIECSRLKLLIQTNKSEQSEKKDIEAQKSNNLISSLVFKGESIYVKGKVFSKSPIFRSSKGSTYFLCEFCSLDNLKRVYLIFSGKISLFAYSVLTLNNIYVVNNLRKVHPKGWHCFALQANESFTLEKVNIEVSNRRLNGNDEKQYINVIQENQLQDIPMSKLPYKEERTIQEITSGYYIGRITRKLCDDLMQLDDCLTLYLMHYSDPTNLKGLREGTLVKLHHMELLYLCGKFVGFGASIRSYIEILEFSIKEEPYLPCCRSSFDFHLFPLFTIPWLIHLADSLVEKLQLFDNLIEEKNQFISQIAEVYGIEKITTKKNLIFLLPQNNNEIQSKSLPCFDTIKNLFNCWKSKLLKQVKEKEEHKCFSCLLECHNNAKYQEVLIYLEEEQPLLGQIRLNQYKQLELFDSTGTILIDIKKDFKENLSDKQKAIQHLIKCLNPKLRGWLIRKYHVVEEKLYYKEPLKTHSFKFSSLLENSFTRSLPKTRIYILIDPKDIIMLNRVEEKPIVKELREVQYNRKELFFIVHRVLITSKMKDECLKCNDLVAEVSCLLKDAKHSKVETKFFISCECKGKSKTNSCHGYLPIYYCLLPHMSYRLKNAIKYEHQHYYRIEEQEHQLECIPSTLELPSKKYSLCSIQKLNLFDLHHPFYLNINGEWKKSPQFISLKGKVESLYLKREDDNSNQEFTIVLKLREIDLIYSTNVYLKSNQWILGIIPGATISFYHLKASITLKHRLSLACTKDTMISIDHCSFDLFHHYLPSLPFYNLTLSTLNSIIQEQEVIDRNILKLRCSIVSINYVELCIKRLNQDEYLCSSCSVFVDDGTAQGELFLDGDLIWKILNISNEEIVKFYQLAIKCGPLIYKSKTECKDNQHILFFEKMQKIQIHGQWNILAERFLRAKSDRILESQIKLGNIEFITKTLPKPQLQAVSIEQVSYRQEIQFLRNKDLEIQQRKRQKKII